MTVFVVFEAEIFTGLKLSHHPNCPTNSVTALKTVMASIWQKDDIEIVNSVSYIIHQLASAVVLHENWVKSYCTTNDTFQNLKHILSLCGYHFQQQIHFCLHCKLSPKVTTIIVAKYYLS